jgi:hypothetical protein
MDWPVLIVHAEVFTPDFAAAGSGIPKGDLVLSGKTEQQGRHPDG